MFKRNVFSILRLGLKTLSSVYCDQVTQCLGPLAFSLVSMTNMDDIPTLRVKQL